MSIPLRRPGTTIHGRRSFCTSGRRQLERSVNDAVVESPTKGTTHRTDVVNFFPYLDDEISLFGLCLQFVESAQCFASFLWARIQSIAILLFLCDAIDKKVVVISHAIGSLWLQVRRHKQKRMRTLLVPTLVVM